MTHKVITNTTRVDKIKNELRDRKLAYAHVFGMDTPASKLVLADLKKFCRVSQSTFNPDARVHALIEGRREVALRILDFLELTLEELVVKYGGINVEI